MDATLADNAKRAAGHLAAGMVKDGMVVGLGTGSTVLYAMETLGDRVRTGLSITGIPTSFQAATRARTLGIPLATLDDYPAPDIAIDGADQVDPGRRAIKGRGAAHLREKCVATASARFVIVVDEAKLVDVLDTAVPLEVLPFALSPVISHVRGMGGEPVLREGVKKDGPVITDNGNMVLDCRFGPIRDPVSLEQALTMIPGVLSCGIFSGLVEKTTVVVGDRHGARVLER